MGLARRGLLFRVAVAALVLVAAADIGSAGWMFTWSLAGYSGEIWDGRVTARRDAEGVKPQTWSLLRAGVPFTVVDHFRWNFSVSLSGSPFYGSKPGYWAVAAPLWLAGAPSLAAIGLVAGVRGLSSGLRRRRGCCPSCGYSLAGLSRAAPCPECGKAPA
jgi:hypothetical protein